MNSASASYRIPPAPRAPSLNSDTSATASSPNSRIGAERSRAGAASLTVEGLLARARRRLRRVTPEQAAGEQLAGALLVDTRTSEQRAVGGTIPGALVIDRSVLEWRLDPSSV